MSYTVQDVARGLAEGQLRLLYQPLIAAHSRSVRGVEALIRWQHPDDGLLDPGSFLPAVEDDPLMADITDWVVRTAAQDAAWWRESGNNTVPVSVNLSATLLSDDCLAERVLGITAEEGLAPELLTLEVTETALTADPETARRAFASLRERGVRISIDDFGTGYTSLASLRDHRFDELKIDRSFVSVIRESPADQAVVRAVVDLGHRLGLEVVAEGVEDETTARVMEQMGCDILQGFCFSPPQTRELTAEWILESGVARSSTRTSRAFLPLDAPAEPVPAPAPQDEGEATDEQRRLAAVDALDLADASREQVLDDLVEVVATVCGTPMAALSVVGADRQWLKAATTGLSDADLPRQLTFCTHTIERPGEVMEVPDVLEDSRFASNPSLAGRIRFYAGAPLVSDDGHPVGALCVLDSHANHLTDEQREALRRLSDVAVRHLETTRSERALRRLCDVMSALSRVHSVSDIPTAAKLVTDAAQALLRADGVGLALAPAAGAVVFETAAQTLVDETHAETGQSLVLDSRTDPATAKVLSTGQPLFVPNAPGSPDLAQWLVRTFGVASLYYVPLQDDDYSLLGLMVAWWRTPQPTLPDRARRRIALLAAETATTLSRLYALAALRDAADTDPLTGLLNRRTFTNALRRLPAGSTVLMVDLDRFKPVNDEGGHQAGDDVLRSFAAQLRAVTRTHDLVARWGGDEFAIALPEMEAAGAEAMLRRLRRAWDRTPTFSSGYTVTTPAETALAALHRADRALYDAKAAGRNEDRGAGDAAADTSEGGTLAESSTA